MEMPRMCCIDPPTCRTQPGLTYILCCSRNMTVSVTLQTCNKHKKYLLSGVSTWHPWCIHPGGTLAASRALRLLWKSGLGKLDLPSSFCVHLPAHNKVGLWRCCFIDRLSLSQGTQKGKRKNQKTRQPLLGENTNEDKFPLSVSKDFSSSYLI